MSTQSTRISAYGLVTNDDRILLCRLSDIVADAAGHWILPGGGLDWGEDPVDAVVREVGEETGLKVNYVGDLLDVDSRVIKFSGDRQVHSIRIVYQADVLNGELKVEKKGGSTDACAWFTLEEANKLPLVHLAKRGLELWKFQR